MTKQSGSQDCLPQQSISKPSVPVAETLPLSPLPNKASEGWEHISVLWKSFIDVQLTWEKIQFSMQFFAIKKTSSEKLSLSNLFFKAQFKSSLLSGEGFSGEFSFLCSFFHLFYIYIHANMTLLFHFDITEFSTLIFTFTCSLFLYIVYDC